MRCLVRISQQDNLPMPDRESLLHEETLFAPLVSLLSTGYDTPRSFHLFHKLLIETAPTWEKIEIGSKREISYAVR